MAMIDCYLFAGGCVNNSHTKISDAVVFCEVLDPNGDWKLVDQ